MTKFKKGQKVMKDGGECYYIDGKVVELVNDKGWDRDSTIPNDYTSIGNNTYHYADDEELELITDYQPITPKVGERYRVLRKLKDFGILVGRVYEIQEVKKDGTALIDDGFHLHTYDFLTTEYLELVEEKKFMGEALTVTQTNVNDVINQAIRAMDMASKPLYVTGMDIGKIEHGSIFKMPTLNKTKQTTMQKLTSALKRVLSADKQTLYKAGVIGGDLELSPQGKEKYVVALFNNEGDHKKAVVEMVAMAQAELDEA